MFQGGGGIETTGSIEAINSMLLQHEAGVLRLFPDWPAAMDASFTRLRAKGAYLVSSEQVAGKITFVDIVSEKGGALAIQSPWGTRAVRAGAQGPTLRPDPAGLLHLTTTAGGVYQLSPE